jgi:hypothetical protein
VPMRCSLIVGWKSALGLGDVHRWEVRAHGPDHSTLFIKLVSVAILIAKKVVLV